MIFGWFPEYDKTIKNEEKILLTDEEDNIKLLLQTTNEEVKLYKEIKTAYPQKDFKNDDKVSIKYFKILEEFYLIKRQNS